jgi:hypothetical protein
VLVRRESKHQVPHCACEVDWIEGGEGVYRPCTGPVGHLVVTRGGAGVCERSAAGRALARARRGTGRSGGGSHPLVSKVQAILRITLQES